MDRIICLLISTVRRASIQAMYCIHEISDFSLDLPSKDMGNYGENELREEIKVNTIIKKRNRYMEER